MLVVCDHVDLLLFWCLGMTYIFKGFVFFVGYCYIYYAIIVVINFSIACDAVWKLLLFVYQFRVASAIVVIPLLLPLLLLVLLYDMHSCS